MINVFLVHEMPLMSSVLASTLEDEPDINVVGYATTAVEAIEKIVQEEVDVILTSSRLPDRGSIRLLKQINEKDPSLDLIVIGVTETREKVLHYIEVGASAYVGEDSTIEEMLSAIRMAEEGKALVPPEITAALMDRLAEYAQIFSDLEIGVNDPSTPL